MTVWPAPDKDGDGAEVWVQETDTAGNYLDRVRAKDKNDNPVFEYNPPEGFQNRPGYDHTDNYVRVSPRGQIVRQPNGEAINIRPGTALVENADGSVEILSGEYAQHLFSLAHDAADSEVGE